MNEHSFVKSMHRYLPSDLYRWKIHDTFTGGVPDAFYAGPAGTLFVEYKYLSKLPKRPTTKLRLGLSQLQLQWLNRMNDWQHPCCVVVGSPHNNVVILQNGAWNFPMAAGDFMDQAQNIEVVAKHIADYCQRGLTHEQRRSTRPARSGR